MVDTELTALVHALTRPSDSCKETLSSGDLELHYKLDQEAIFSLLSGVGWGVQHFTTGLACLYTSSILAGRDMVLASAALDSDTKLALGVLPLSQDSLFGPHVTLAVW